MEEYKIENLTFSYDDKTNALSNISMTIKQGEFITVCGRSGCGKSTLLRHLKTALTPKGSRSGKIFFEGVELYKIKNIDQSRKIGFIMQDPDNQIVTDKVWHELAFGAESLGMKTKEIRLRVAETSSYFGIQNLFHKNTSELSGGQKQLLNLASIMVMRPSVLILDEPVSQLDPIAADEFIQTLKRINRDFGTTIIISEHRLEELMTASDKVIVLDKGQIIAQGSAREIGEMLKNSKNPMYLAMPAPMRIYSATSSSLLCPVTIKEGREWLKSIGAAGKSVHKKRAEIKNDTVIELKDIHFRYNKNSSDVLNGVSEKIYRGEIYAIAGGNGTGKTTCLKVISGVLKPYRGKIAAKSSRISQLPQNPQTLFVKNTVYDDLCDVLGKKAERKKIAEAAKICEIEELLDRHPYDLSGGEQQRAALAKVLLCEPEILLLDEPTKGLDPFFKIKLASIIKALAKKGVTIIMVSHDIEFCAEYADRAAMFFDGTVIASGTPEEIFLNNRFYTTAAAKMSEGIIENALTADDIVNALGGHMYRLPHEAGKKNEISERNENNIAEQKKNIEKKQTKKIKLPYLFSLIIIPLTVIAGKYLFDDRRFYFISLLVILEAMIPFAVSFERGKPRVRDIVLIGTMCAISVASRTVFYMLPQIKPMMAMVIISGIGLGGEAGFLVGAVSAFVSNIFFGQGAWTPWQMFAFGIIGWLAGVIFKNTKKKRYAISAFGFFAAIIIYGILMNVSTMLMVQSVPSWEMFLTYELSGISFDIIHALSTAVFLWLASDAMLKKLDRI